MTAPGERRPPGSAESRPARAASPSLADRLRPRSLGPALMGAVLVMAASALAWALFKGVLELSVGLLAVAAFGGWGIGAVLWQVRASPLLAVAIAALAWLAGLIGTWLVAMALLPASSRTFLERLTNTPFTDWLSPQFGLLEIGGLVIYLVAAAYGARPRR